MVLDGIEQKQDSPHHNRVDLYASRNRNVRGKSCLTVRREKAQDINTIISGIPGDFNELEKIEDVVHAYSAAARGSI